MKLNDKNLDTIDLERDAQAVIDRLNRLAREGKYVFRGYGRQEELYPNIIRGKTNYVDIEDKLLKDFEKYGSNYFHATTPIDFMSYAQHFGLPTRLLDFTHNPFIALSFALYSPKSNGNYSMPEDKKYYYVRYASLDNNLCIQSIPLKEDMYNNKLTRTDSLAVRACQCIDSMTDLFGNNVLNRSILVWDEFKDSLEAIVNKQKRISTHAILFIDPNQSNQRIIMQQGLFMFPYTLNKEDHLKILNNNSCCIKIHKDLRNELIQYLDTLGYNTFRLMPDLSSICEAVKRRNIDERSKKNSTFKQDGKKQ